MFEMSQSARTQALRHWHDPLIQSRGFDAWSFTFGPHWSWSKNHRRIPVAYLEIGQGGGHIKGVWGT